MKKSLAGLGVVLLVVAAFALAAAAAAPNLAGNWQINGKAVLADGTLQTIHITDLIITPTSDPTLFSGTLTSPDGGGTNFMTIMMDAGANMHFTTSNFDGSEYVTRTIGRGTASTNKIVGSWSDDRGKTGNFIFTRLP